MHGPFVYNIYSVYEDKSCTTATQACGRPLNYLSHTYVHTLLLTPTWPGSPLCSGFVLHVLPHRAGVIGHSTATWT